MIIQIRGTSGSGKSTIVKKVMDKLGGWNPVFVKPRRKPLYYRNKKYPGIIVLGHYEIDCGGCDTIGSAPQVFNVLKDTEFDIAITEGLLWSEDVVWTEKLVNPVVFLLKTTPEECLRRVVNRRGGTQGNMERVIRKLTVRVGTIQRAYNRLEAQGIECYTVSDKMAARIILSRINEYARA